jgi:hypothetical protein
LGRLTVIVKRVNTFFDFLANWQRKIVTISLLLSNARQRSIAFFAACTVRQHEFTAAEDSWGHFARAFRIYRALVVEAAVSAAAL